MIRARELRHDMELLASNSIPSGTGIEASITIMSGIMLMA